MGPDLDMDLLRAWKAGDRRAGDRLFRRHLKTVRRYFSNKAPADAVEDLCQRTFEGCVKGLDSFREDARFKTYLLAIARKTLAYFLRTRKNRRHDQHIDFDEVTIGEVIREPSAATRLARSRTQELILAGLRAIVLNEQILLELFYWENLAAREIARIHDVPEGTVRSRLRKAKANLKQQIERLADSPEEFAFTLSAFEARTWVEEVRKAMDRDERKAVRGG